MIKEKINSIQAKLTENIPITKSMGLEIIKFDDTGMLISAPLHLNRNDKGTAFAGSLFSVAVLTGWACVSQKLTDEGIDAEVAVYSSNITYHKPVISDFTAVCNLSFGEEWVKFRDRVKKKSNGRIVLTVDITHNDERRVSFRGEYYAWLKKLNNSL